MKPDHLEKQLAGFIAVVVGGDNLRLAHGLTVQAQVGPNFTEGRREVPVAEPPDGGDPVAVAFGETLIAETRPGVLVDQPEPVNASALRARVVPAVEHLGFNPAQLGEDLRPASSGRLLHSGHVQSTMFIHRWRLPAAG